MNMDMLGGKTLAGDPDNGDRHRTSRWRITAWTSVALVLLLPWIAMQFTDEVVWTVADFVFFGALLVGAGVALELAARKTTDPTYRSAAGLALAATLLLVWVNGAVGLIGDAANDANMMYYGVIAVGLVGAIIARFQPHGMARVMIAMALAQVVVTVIALVSETGGTAEYLLLNGGFVALFAGSAWLFRRAARGHAEQGVE